MELTSCPVSPSPASPRGFPAAGKWTFPRPGAGGGQAGRGFGGQDRVEEAEGPPHPNSSFLPIRELRFPYEGLGGGVGT